MSAASYYSRLVIYLGVRVLVGLALVRMTLR